MYFKKKKKKLKCGGGLVTKLCPTLATPWTVAGQSPLSMGFSRQEYWSGLPLSPPGDLPDPGIEAESPHCRQIVYQLSYLFKTMNGLNFSRKLLLFSR